MYRVTKKTFKNDYNSLKDQAEQQMLIMCSYNSMTKDDFIHDFALPFEITTKAHQETRDLFDWAIQEIDVLLKDLVESGLLIDIKKIKSFM